MGNGYTYLIKKGDFRWRLPGRKKIIAYSTRAVLNVIMALAEDGDTIKELKEKINYMPEARDIFQKYIDAGYGDVVVKTFFR